MMSSKHHLDAELENSEGKSCRTSGNKARAFCAKAIAVLRFVLVKTVDHLSAFVATRLTLARLGKPVKKHCVLIIIKMVAVNDCSIRNADEQMVPMTKLTGILPFAK
jgi:hypothetical protein